MIDFDEASKCWLGNKRRTKSGTYVYTCEYTYKYGKRCGRDVFKTTDYCRQHYALSMNYTNCPVLGAGHYGIVVETPQQTALKLFKDTAAPYKIGQEAAIQTAVYELFAAHFPQVRVPRILDSSTEVLDYKNTPHLKGISMERLLPPTNYTTQVHTLLGYHGNDTDTEWGMRITEPVSPTNPSRGFFASPYTLEDIWEDEGSTMTIERLAYLMGRAHSLMLENGILPIDLEWVWSKGSLCVIDFGLCEFGRADPIQFLNSESSHGLKNDFYIPHEGDRGYAEFMRGYLNLVTRF